MNTNSTTAADCALNEIIKHSDSVNPSEPYYNLAWRQLIKCLEAGERPSLDTISKAAPKGIFYRGPIVTENGKRYYYNLLGPIPGDCDTWSIAKYDFHGIIIECWHI